MKEEPETNFIKTEPEEHHTETGTKMSQDCLQAKKLLKQATKTPASRKGKQIANTTKDMGGPPNGKPPEQELVIVKPVAEPQSDLFADIFQNEKDLETLDSIVNVARQNSRVENEDDEESLVGVMSDEDDSSSSSVSDVVTVGDNNDEGVVGIMSSSDESSRDGEDSCGDKRKDTSIIGNKISHFGHFGCFVVI